MVVDAVPAVVGNGTAQPDAAGAVPAAAAPIQTTLPLDPPALAAPEASAPASEGGTPTVVAPEAPAADAPPVAKPTLLQEHDTKTAEAKPTEGEPAKPVETPAEVKPEETAKPVEAAKPAEAAPAEAAKPDAAAPVEYKYEVPEGITLDDGLRTSLKGALDTFRANPAEGAQALLDLHAQTMRSFAEQTSRDQHTVWNKTREGWRSEVMADEQIGGASHETSLRAIARMRDLFVPEAERASFNQFLEVTGAGDHPAFLKMLHRAARLYDEPAAPAAEAKPPPDIGRQNGRGAGLLYDHPRSPSGRQ